MERDGVVRQSRRQGWRSAPLRLESLLCQALLQRNYAFRKLSPSITPIKRCYLLRDERIVGFCNQIRKSVQARDLPRPSQIPCFENHCPNAGRNNSPSRARETVLHVVRKQRYLDRINQSCCLSIAGVNARLDSGQLAASPLRTTKLVFTMMATYMCWTSAGPSSTSLASRSSPMGKDPLETRGHERRFYEVVPEPDVAMWISSCGLHAALGRWCGNFVALFSACSGLDSQERVYSG